MDHSLLGKQEKTVQAKSVIFYFRSLLSATCVFVNMVEVVGQEDVMEGIAAVEVSAVEVGAEGEEEQVVVGLEEMEDLVEEPVVVEEEVE